MRNILTKSLAGAAGILLLATVSFAQTAKRIDFSKSNSLVWEENVAANSSKSFVFHATKGQKLKLSMVDDTDAGSMDLGKISIEPNTDPFEMDVEVTKDYSLSVTNNTRKPTSFRISISLEDPEIKTEFDKNDQNFVRILFPKGDNSANVTKEIPANGSLDFLVNVKKGQTFGFQVGYEGKASDVRAFLTEPDLQDVTIESGPEERKEFKIKKTGDHRITINNMSKKKITITIYVDAF